jgi:hypothetical protein
MFEPLSSMPVGDGGLEFAGLPHRTRRMAEDGLCRSVDAACAEPG